MDYLNDILNQIGSLKGLALVAAACFAVGYAIRLIPVIPNKWIPAFVLPAGPMLAPFILSPGEASPDLRHPIIGIITQGLLVGVVVHYLHEKVVSRLESWLKDKLPGGGAVPSLMLAGTVALVGFGCKHLSPKANVFATLEATQAAVHQGMNAYGEAYRAGKITPERAAKVRQRHADYRTAFDAACIAAQFNLSTATPESVKALAQEVLNLIHNTR